MIEQVYDIFLFYRIVWFNRYDMAKRGRGGGHTNLYLVNVGICEFSFCPT